MDRLMWTFQRLHVFQRSGAFFVVRVKLRSATATTLSGDAGAGVISDHTVSRPSDRPNTTQTRCAAFVITTSSMTVD